MKNRNIKNFLVIAIFLSFVSGFMIVTIARGAEPLQEPQPAVPIKKETSLLSIDALTPGGNGPGSSMAPMSPMDISTITTDFEATEGTPPGFSPGYCAQNGWTAFASSTTVGQISNTNPSVGAQHLNIANDPTLGAGTYIGCFSPDIGPQTVEPTWLEVDIAISGSGGADYLVNPQSISQGLTTARMQFSWLGNILVSDDRGSGFEMVDTGVAWNIGPYTTVRIEADPGANTINYYYGGTLIYTGIVFGGTTMEQVVLLHDNWNFGDVGDFDNLQVYAGTYPTNINLVKMQSHSTNALPFWGLLIVLAGIFVPLALKLRQRF